MIQDVVQGVMKITFLIKIRLEGDIIIISVFTFKKCTVNKIDLGSIS